MDGLNPIWIDDLGVPLFFGNTQVILMLTGMVGWYFQLISDRFLSPSIPPADADGGFGGHFSEKLKKAPTKKISHQLEKTRNKNTGKSEWYCWWTKSCTTWDG